MEASGSDAAGSVAPQEPEGRPEQQLLAGVLGIIQKLAPAGESAFAQGYIDDLRSRRFGDLAKKSGPELQGPDMAAKLREFAARLPDGDPRSVELVGSHVFHGPDRHGDLFTGLDHRFFELINEEADGFAVAADRYSTMFPARD